MIFNSLVFIQFAVIFFCLWPWLRQTRFRYVFLIGASCLFYGFAGWWFVPLLLATASLDFYIAQRLYESAPDHKKRWLVFSLVSNLGVLAIFKYAGFFATTVNSITSALSVPTSIPVLHLVLPIGISFYTFQSLSYVFDVYAGKLEPTRKPLHFLSIVTLFPHLVAGPIVRVSHILPQIAELRKPSVTLVWQGLNLVVLGLFKKMVLADNLAPFVDAVYSSGDRAGGGLYLLATICFAFQIYYDFSGYTDTARGLAKWVGVEFEVNFKHPYSAIGFSDFWSRWHISLSRWIRDYLFIPLGGSRVSELKVHRNIWISMLLSGLWHGANFTFIIWGGLHAFYQSLERITKWPQLLAGNPFSRLAGMLLTFTMTSIGWVFFRAETTADAMHVLGKALRPIEGISSIGGFVSGKPFYGALALSILIEGVYAVRVASKKEDVPWCPNWLRVLGVAAMLFAVISIAGPGKAFIYFEF